ncbi:ROK family protein [Nocardia carnea]|uniref:ROK family protein n=1 Tax=Nocardia carnea TaxID=37328 RepID=UPI00245863A6|nr:ROK family protein [Nocardia carnea]
MPRCGCRSESGRSRGVADDATTRAERVAASYTHRTGLTKATVVSLVEPLLANGVLSEDPAVAVAEDEVVRAPNLPRLVGYRQGPALARSLRTNLVRSDNEANLAAHAHLWPRDTLGPDFVYVSGDVGVGAGLVLQGRVHRGVHRFGGELGHVAIERKGRACSCGGRGCVEQYAGLPAILRAAGCTRTSELQRALGSGDPAARAAVTDAGSALGVALASLVSICEIPVVVLGGAYCVVYDHLRPAVAAELERRVLAAPAHRTELRVSALGEDSAVRGAAGAITWHLCTEPAGLDSLLGFEETATAQRHSAPGEKA